ncbi:hypothetical protein YPPY98_1293, partial [Yersinia pestis PY-98]
MVVFQPLAG